MIRVLVVDGDAFVAESVAAVPGYTVVGVAAGAAHARAEIRATAPDLVLLGDGATGGPALDLVREADVDTFVLSAAVDAAAVAATLRAGAMQYLVTPCTAERLTAGLAAYRAFRERLAGPLSQLTVDTALDALHGNGSARHPSPSTTRLVAERLRAAQRPLSAAEIARELGIARATAQRHLGALAERGAARMSLRYGSAGRPEHEYRWVDGAQ